MSFLTLFCFTVFMLKISIEYILLLECFRRLQWAEGEGAERCELNIILLVIFAVVSYLTLDAKVCWKERDVSFFTR